MARRSHRATAASDHALVAQWQSGKTHIVTDQHADEAPAGAHVHGKHVVMGSTPIIGSKRDTKSIGDVAEASVLAALIRTGRKVLLPFGENHRYDLVIDDGGQFLRVQVKAGRYRRGAITFRSVSNHHHRNGSFRGYQGEADLFGVFCAETNEVYLVPVDEAPVGQVSLRRDPSTYGNQYTPRLAEQYRI